MSVLPPAPDPGLVINSKTISMIVGIFAIIASVNYFFNYINSYETRLSKIEYIDTLTNNQLDNLTKEIKILNNKITDLTVELKEIGAIQKNNRS